MEKELVSIRECARRIGVSDTAIHKAIKSGRVKVAARNEKNGRPLLDFEDVVASWYANTDPSMQRAGEGNGFVQKSSIVSNVGGKAPAAQPADDEEPAEIVGGEAVPPYNASKALREAYAAKSAKLDYEQKAGLLVPRSEVHAEFFGLARKVRDAILAVPDRIDAELASITEVRRVNIALKKHLNDALQYLVDQAESKQNAQVTQ